MRQNHRKETPNPPIRGHAFIPDFNPKWQEDAKTLRGTYAMYGLTIHCTTQRVKINGYDLGIVVITAHQ